MKDTRPATPDATVCARAVRATLRKFLKERPLVPADRIGENFAFCGSCRRMACPGPSRGRSQADCKVS